MEKTQHFNEVARYLKKLEIFANDELLPVMKDHKSYNETRHRFYAVFDGKTIIIKQKAELYGELIIRIYPFARKNEFEVAVTWDTYGKTRFYKSFEPAVLKIKESIKKGVKKTTIDKTQIQINKLVSVSYRRAETSRTTV
jgi:hypothetical protein